MSFRQWKFWTSAAILASVAGLVVWDLIVVTTAPNPGGLDNATVSRQVLQWVTMSPTLSLSIGVLAGHWTWPIERWQSGPRWKYYALGALGVLTLLLDVFRVLPTVTPIVYVLAGIPLGHYLWSQRVKT